MFAKRTLFLALLLLVTISYGQNSPKEIASTNSRIDSLCRVAGTDIQEMNYESSLQNLESARQLSQSVNNKNRIGLTSNYLAQVHLQLGNYEQAGVECLEAITIQRSINDTPGLGSSYLTAAQIQLKLNNNDKAKEYLDQAELIFEKLEDQFHLATTFLYQGNRELAANNPEPAIINYNRALSIFNKEGKDEYLRSKAALQKGKAHAELTQYDMALIAANMAHDVSVKNKYPHIEVESLELLSNIASVNGDYEKAFNDLKEYNEKNAEYFGNNANENQNTVVITNALETDTLMTPDNYEPYNTKANKLTSVLVIALFTLLCLLALSLYKNNNLRAKANELLQTKNTELFMAKENAEKASVVKAQFLSTITHELRTPMYAVTGLTHLLLHENPTPEQKKHLDSLKFSGEYLLSLINNILDLNKLEANKVEVEQTTFNLRKRVDDVIFALDRSAQEKGNQLVLEFEKDIPDQIIGDPLMISQILINLIGNGNKFTRDGQVIVRVQKISENSSQVYLHFEVEDTGEGISKKKQKNIFQNFTQGSVQINRKFGGTGLGLSIVKRLLDLQNSKIELESTLGKGSKFFFDIKYNLTKDASNQRNIEKVYDIDYAALEGRKILVVEDNKINQMITRKILEKNKMECEVADNGEIAIEKVRFEAFDLVLMDIHMPGISGIEATQKIREFNKDLPILALTAVTIDENIDDFYLAGFNDIIPKPYKVEEFFSKIHTSLKRKNVII